MQPLGVQRAGVPAVVEEARAGSRSPEERGREVEMDVLSHECPWFVLMTVLWAFGQPRLMKKK